MRRNTVVELFACHFNFGQSSTDTQTEGTSSYRNFYDPDREYVKKMLAYEMYGPGTNADPGYGREDTFGWMGGTGDSSSEIDPVTGLPIHKKRIGDPQPASTSTTAGATMAGAATSPSGYYGYGAAPPVKYDSEGRPYYDYGATGAPSSTSAAPPTTTLPGGTPTRGAPPTLGPRRSLAAYSTDPYTKSALAASSAAGTNIPGWDEPGITPVGPTGGGIPQRMPPTTLPPRGEPGYHPPYPGYDTPVPPGGGPPPGDDVPPNSDASEWGKGGASGNRALSSGQLYGAFGGLMRSPGYSDVEKNAMTQEGMNAARSQYAGAQGLLARRAAATGNTAGYAAGVSALGRSEADTYGRQARQNIIDFAKEKQRRRELGLQGMGGLYTGETNYLSGLMGQRAGLSSSPIGRLSNTKGSGNYLGTNFGLSIS